MSEEDFVTGDVVNLNSGGPDMTVELVSGEDVSVAFFDGEGVMQTTKFPKKCVKKKVIQ